MTVVTTKTVEVIQVDWTALAVKVEEDVMAKLYDDLEQWKDDISMRAMFLQDAADGLEVCILLAEGKWEKAEDRLRDMDTAAREHVWDFIDRHSCNDLFSIMRKQKAA